MDEAACSPQEILRKSIGLVLAGLAVGGVLAYLATQLVANRLYAVQPQDPVTLVSAVAGLVLIAISAAYLPARRASRVHPMAALHRL